MDLHRTTGKPDWEVIQPGDRSRWQSIAANTHGAITPANLLSLFGFGLAVFGLCMLVQRHYIFGGSAIAVGRLCDIGDGWLAQRTGTKSPLGELVDASIDKVITFLTIITFYIASLAPFWALAILTAPHIIISVITLYAVHAKRQLHPSRVGKLSMFTAWASMVGFVLMAILHHLLPLNILTYALVIVSGILGFAAAIGYAGTGRSNQASN